MEYTKIITETISTYWYLIPVFMIILIIKSSSSWLKGIFGELIVNVFTKLYLDKDKYYLIKNVTLPTEKGSTQIDHIIVSKYGIFVVETKNMKGWIFGSVRQKQWTQKIYKKSYQFQNPLQQNYKHTKTLGRLLNIDESKLCSVIVFVGDSQFKTAMPENVTYGMGYIRYVKSKTIEILSESEVQNIINAIENDRLKPSFKTNREHIKHVKKIIAEKKTTPSCPKCNGTMVLRKTKRGKHTGKKFWGCGNFPSCRHVINLQE